MTSLLHSTEPTPCSSSRRMAFLSSMLRHSACQSREEPAGYIVRAQPGPWGAARALFSPAAPVACSKGCLEGFLLCRTHDHVELRSAGLHVSLIGALERLGRVPRLHQQHRVPEGADAVAERLEVRVDVGLPDHVVAHPEEHILLPQPVLLDEATERVEQRVDLRLEEPAHEHVGQAHVRRVLALQPLAHGQVVLLFPAGDVVLVDVAVDRDAHGERGLALRHPLDVDLLHLGVDLLYRVARQQQQQLAHALQRHA
eukprot:scaffold70325_cov66-Phaeocystis_antarctica.AAC.2